MTTTDIIEIEIQIHLRSQSHIWVSTSGDREDAVQLPRSSVRIEKTTGSLAILTIGEDMAIGKGLI
ncbi:hypothetical protein [Mangrovicoccus sp. HB161399]|uniref:hypothetical protein n=1 Tax=Mangrovicoccus sp. HB161399 TaxID=2720392 RepID=UPI00155248E8|nr:hypothetical protein [Mangrovicoccus sp. HB161399]